MSRRVIAMSLAFAVLFAGSAALATDGSAREARLVKDGVTVAVTPHGARLANDVVQRQWSFAPGGAVSTTLLTDGAGGSLAKPAPDFSITVDGVPTTSTSGWALLDAKPKAVPFVAGHPASGHGVALLFRYASVAPAPPGLELDRLVALRPSSHLIETSSTLISVGPAARVTSYSLDQIVPTAPTLPAEVQAYNGGSDWRDDYRHVSRPTGAFDREGEVVRFGADRGYFFVSLRRGGSMSRVGRDAGGRTWVGVDWAHDLLDAGPILTDPPDYNRVDNPADPVPVRGRTLPPKGTLDLGTAVLGIYRGGAATAAATFTDDFTGTLSPAFASLVGLNTFHPWGHGSGMSDANLRRQVAAAAALGVETFMLDDQWQGGPGGESGDWRWDPRRFPDYDHNGRPDIVDAVHGAGMQLGLWMSPLEFNGASTTYAAHPGWACAPTGDVTAQIEDDAGLGVWDATNPGFQDYIVGVVNRLVRSYGVSEFKFDFMAWVDCGAHDYADYEDAFVRIVERMETANPGVRFEIDETNDQRCWPFESLTLGTSWFDNGHLHGSGPVEKLLHDVWSAAPWVPTSSIGVGALDGTLKGAYAGRRGVDFLAPLAMLTHVTLWTDLTKLTTSERAETARWIGWFRAHRQEFGTSTFELTSRDPLDGKSWAAFQPWNRRAGSGFVFAFRPAGAPARHATVSLQALAPESRYRLTDVRTGRVLTVASGAALAHGLRLTLRKASGLVLSVSPV